MQTYDNQPEGGRIGFRRSWWQEVCFRLRRILDREREMIALRNAVGMMAEARGADSREYLEMRDSLMKARQRIRVLEAHVEFLEIVKDV